MNYADYPKAKAIGKMTIAKIGDETCLVACQKYDPETGAPTAPECVQLNMGNIEEMRAALKAQAEALTAATAGLDALEADMKKALD